MYYYIQNVPQVIAGDAKGAKQTQEEFVRTGIIVSQVNSLVHAAKGDVVEARKIQQEVKFSN
jgi:hypothetical protein